MCGLLSLPPLHGLSERLVELGVSERRRGGREEGEGRGDEGEGSEGTGQTLHPVPALPQTVLGRGGGQKDHLLGPFFSLVSEGREVRQQLSLPGVGVRAFLGGEQ